MEKKQQDFKRHDENRLLSFLQKTKEGKYAKIEQSSLSFVRFREKSEFVEPIPEGSLFYSIG